MTEPVQPGCYVCVRTKGVLAWLIRLATHSPYDHTFVAGYDGEIVEALLTDVQVNDVMKYRDAMACSNVAEPMTGAQRAKVIETAKAAVGEEYGVLDIGALGLASLGLGWQLLFKLIRGEKAFICSQLAVVAARSAGLDWSCGKPYADEVTPADLSRRAGVRPVVLP